MFGWAVERIPDKKREEWLMALDAPLPVEEDTGIEVEMWGDEEEAAAWVNAQASIGRGA